MVRASMVCGRVAVMDWLCNVSAHAPGMPVVAAVTSQPRPVPQIAAFAVVVHGPARSPVLKSCVSLQTR